MDYDAVMAELAARLDTIVGLGVTAYPPDSITPPAAFPNGDGQVEFDLSYAKGMEQVTFPLVVAVSAAWSRTAWSRLLGYISSVKAALETGAGTSFDVVEVKAAEFGQVTIGGAQYIAVSFTVEVTGRGN